MLPYPVLLGVLAGTAFASSLTPPREDCNLTGWDLNHFKAMVVFGDSYTDDSRYAYFTSHVGNPPPVGYDNPVVRVPGQYYPLSLIFLLE